MRAVALTAFLFALVFPPGETLKAANRSNGVPFDHVVTVRFAGEPEFPVTIVIRNTFLGPIVHSFLVPDESPLSIHCELPPGDFLIESILTRPSRQYWDSSPASFSIREGDGMGRILGLPQELFHRFKIEPIGPKEDFVAGKNAPLLSWKPVEGAALYRLYWTEKRAPEKRSERDGSMDVELPFFDFDFELTPGARYEWRVEALDENNRSIGHWGPSHFFADEQARLAFQNPPERPDLGGYLGVMIGETDNPLPGIRVSQVLAGTPAFVAGMQPGDVITKFAGIPLADISITAFIEIARSQAPGTAVEVEYARGFNDPEIIPARVTMGMRPDFAP